VKFDLVLTNPPFQDSLNRNKTPHKLWIDFALRVFHDYIKDGGSFVQVSPASFASPSNKVLLLMGKFATRHIRLDTEKHFSGVGSSFSDYWIIKREDTELVTVIETAKERFEIKLDSSVFYLPNDLGATSLSIHSKVVFSSTNKVKVEWDYVVAHNIRRYDKNPTLSETQSEIHIYPVFHTNRSKWWSSVRQEWAASPKVMWTRSGYTVPFYDNGVLGGTDMAYFIRVEDREKGENLAHNMNLLLMKYIYKTAKWSGFGNERVFTNLPELTCERKLTDEELFDHFNLSAEEVNYVLRSVERHRSKA
jgi:hypothetical protein